MIGQFTYGIDYYVLKFYAHVDLHMVIIFHYLLISKILMKPILLKMMVFKYSPSTIVL